jgi:hypothetical protein
LLVSDFDDCDDPVVAVNDDDLITNHEVHVPAPLGMDFDERRGNLYHPDASWHRGADADGEVDVVNPRHIPAGQDCLSDFRALLRCQVDAAARLALLRLALLRLTLLSLPLLRSLAWLSLLPGLPLLRRLTGLALLTLLALRRLTGGLIALLLSLATLLGLALLALLALALLRLTLLALVTALLRGASGLLASLRLTALLRLTLLALVLRTALALTGATLVVARSCRAAFRLRAALGAAAGFAARHVLG